MKPLFQFSAFDNNNKEYEQSKQIVKKLGGQADESKVGT